MRKILIVGAGQSGLHLAHGLLDHGYDVTVITAQTSEEIRTSAPSITQFSLPLALGCERRRSLDFWWSQAPHIDRVQLGLYPPGAAPMVISGSFADYGGYGIAVDRRVKMADWLEYFEDRGGKVVIHGVTVSDLDYFARLFDLTVVAVGGGDLANFFAPDPNRSSGAHPRVITQVLVDDVGDSIDGPGAAEVISAPEGRIFLTPILTREGPAYSLCVMGAPGAELDGSHLQPERGRPNPDTVVSWIQDVLQGRFSGVYDRVKGALPTDGRSALVTGLQPQVRTPVDALPSGGLVLGLADVVVETDPIAGQTWTNSSACAEVYLDRILAHGDAPLDRAALGAMFEVFWADAPAGKRLHAYQGVGRASATLSDTLHHMWNREMPPHFAQVLGAATTDSEVADRFVGGLADPRDYAWLYDPQTAQTYLAEVANRHT